MMYNGLAWTPSKRNTAITEKEEEMFHTDDELYFVDLATRMLEAQSFEEVLNENDLSDVGVLAILIQHGLIDTERWTDLDYWTKDD